MIAALFAARIVGMGYGLSLVPDVKIEAGDQEFWLSEKTPGFNDSLFWELPPGDQEKILEHMPLPGDRKFYFGKDALVDLAGQEHSFTSYKRLKKLSAWLPPGTPLSGFSKSDEVNRARNRCLAWAYDVGLCAWLDEKHGDLRFSEDGASFLEDVFLAGPLSMGPQDAERVVKEAANPKDQGKTLRQLLQAHRRLSLLRFRDALEEYYDLARANTGKDRKIRELYLKGVEAYADGDYKGAIIYWNQVLKRDPDNQDAREGIEKAKKLLGK